MPKLNDHGIGGGSKSLMVPIYPIKTSLVWYDSANALPRPIYGDAMTTLPESSYQNAGCAVGDAIYLIGMLDSGKTCYKYDVNSKIWTKLADATSSEGTAWAIAHGTNIYYAKNDDRAIYKYDTLTNTHSVLVSNSNHYMTNSSAVFRPNGSQIYIFGGSYSTAHRTYCTKVVIGTGATTRMSAIPVTMANHCAMLHDNNNEDMYLFGGINNSTKAYKFDSYSNSYTALKDIPFGYYGGMIVRIDNYIYLINSASSTGATAMYAYNVSTNAYTSLGTTPNARQYGVADIIDNVLYMMGGGGSSSSVRTSGDSATMRRLEAGSMSQQKLVKGCKLYCNGTVYKGTIEGAINGTPILNIGTRLNRVNNVITIPSTGDYYMRSTTYATMGG